MRDGGLSVGRGYTQGFTPPKPVRGKRRERGERAKTQLRSLAPNQLQTVVVVPSTSMVMSQVWLSPFSTKVVTVPEPEPSRL